MRLMAFRLPMFAFVLLAAGSVRAAPPTPPAEVPERVAHLRELLASEQGAAILDLLGDPRVRQAIMQDPDSTPQGGSPSATAGEMMADMLGGLRTRLWNILADLNQIPDQMAQVLDKTRSPAADTGAASPHRRCDRISGRRHRRAIPVLPPRATMAHAFWRRDAGHRAKTRTGGQ